MNGWQQLLTTISVLLGSGGLVALVKTWADRRKRGADVTTTLSDAALKWVEQFQEETAGARREAAQARAEAAAASAAAHRELDSMRLELAAARREVAQVRDEAERALRSIRLLVMSPDATLEQIRQHVTGPGWLNGR